ncbi:MAG: Smr/MutS family protein [Paracoccaceae bacterium]
MKRRKRGKLTEDDHEVWEKVTQTTVPLHPIKLSPPQFTPKPTRAPLAQKLHKPAIRPLTRIGGALPEALVTINLVLDPMKASEKPDHQMDRKNFDRLRKGKIKPDARLDLHGMTAAQAHFELTAFIHRSHAARKRLALVITGKGNSTREKEEIMPTRQGILRHSLPHWLNRADLRPKILQITPAHAKHGGGGAYYVYLRRTR